MIWRRVICSTDSEKAEEKISKLLIDCSALLAVSRCFSKQKRSKHNVYVRLPDDVDYVKAVLSYCKIAFNSWKENDYLDGNEFAKITAQNLESIVSNYRIFSIDLKLKNSPNFATQHVPMRTYVGGC